MYPTLHADPAKAAWIDATAKDETDGYTRGWPDAIEMRQEIRDLVDRRWSEYGLPEPP